MIKALGRFLGGSVGALLIAGAVHAQPQVTIGPMAPSGAPGQQVGFDITYSGPTDTNGISFNILYPADVAAEFTPVFRSGSTTKIQCATASDLDPGITTSGVVLASGKIAFTVIGLSLDTGPIAFGRTGVVGTCQFMIANTASGTVPLACDPTSGQTTASDVNGNNLTAACVDGQLTVSGGTPPTPTPTPNPNEVTIGPMTPSGAPGQQVGFDITYSGPTDANGISFNILYPADVAAEFTPVFRSGSTTKIQCATASDLDPGITTSGVVLASGKIAFTVIGLSLDTGPIAFGRTGVVGTCQFMIANTASGTVPLACDPTSGQTTASDVNGNNLPATCVDGTLTVSAPAVTLSAAISPTDTSITVSDASSINVGDTLKIDDEQMIVTGKSGNTLTVTRAANGTTGVAHAAETPVTILAAPPTPTSTPVTPATATPTPTSVASPTVTVAPSVTASATRTVPPIGASPTPGCPTCQNDDDGCQIGAAGHSSAWLLLIPAIGLLVVRRRRR